MKQINAREAVLEHFRWDGGHADVWAVFRNRAALAAVVRGLAEPFRRAGVTAVAGLESRGFLLGAAVAVQLGVGFVPVRKAAGLFPGEKLTRETDRDYRGLRHTLRLQRAALSERDRVLLVDDWIETGSQAAAVRELVLECGAGWAGCAVIVDQLTGRRRPALGPIHGLLRAAELPAALNA